MVPFVTMGAESLRSVGIGELAPWTEAAPAQAAAACALAAALLLYRLRVRRRGGGRALLEAGDLLVLGTLMLALANVRNELFLMASMALALSDIQGEVAGPRVKQPHPGGGSCTAALLASLGLLAATVPRQTPIEASAARAMAALESSGAEQGDAVICDIDVGSELELADTDRCSTRAPSSTAPSSTGARTPGGQLGTCWRATRTPSREPAPISRSSPRGPTPRSRTRFPGSGSPWCMTTDLRGLRPQALIGAACRRQPHSARPRTGAAPGPPPHRDDGPFAP